MTEKGERERDGDDARGRRACVVTRESEGSDYLRGLFFAPPLYVARRPFVRDRLGGGTTKRAAPFLYDDNDARACSCKASSQFVVVTRRRRGEGGGGYRSSSRPPVIPPACSRVVVRVCSAPRRDDGVKRARYSRRRRGNGARGATRRGGEGNSGRFLVEPSGASFRGEVLARDGTERSPRE